MASFTDNIPQFNPYVQQLPVEAMLQVGMTKQSQYDQGIQTIQSKIDNIAGLDIINDVDKKYLQTKLNNLQTSLRKVAAGDFSNYQLVNSVGGMVGSIAKDSNIQNAVKSTSIYREQESLIAADREGGLENPNNTNKFYKDAQSWLNATEPGQMLQARYFKPVDVWSKISSIAKEVGVDESVIQQLYQTDEAGNLLYETDKNGNKTPIWNPIMVERHLKGKDAGKILRAFQSGLTAADYRQLAIDGEMSKANDTPEMLEEEIRGKSLLQLKKIERNVIELEIALYDETQKNKKDENAIASITNQLEYFKEFKSKLETSIDNNIKAAYSNPDAVRASLYTNDYLFDMANTLSSQEERINYSVSPMFEVTMANNKFQLEQNKLKRLIERDRVKDDQWQKTYDQKERINAQKNLPNPPPGTPISIDINESALKIVGDQNDEYNNRLAAYNDTAYKLALEYFKEIPEYKGFSEDEIRRILYEKATEVGSSIDPNSGDVNQYVQEIASKQIEKWKINPDAVPQEFQSTVERLTTLSQAVTFQKKQMEDVERQALENLKNKGIDARGIDDFKKTLVPFDVTITKKNGVTKEVNISKDDIMDLANIMVEDYTLLNTDVEKSLARQSKERLKLKYKEDYEEVLRETAYLPKKQRGIPFNKELNKATQFVRQSKLNDLTIEKARIYNERGIIQQGMSHPVIIGKEKEKDVQNKIGTVLNKYKINEVTGYDQDKMMKALLGTGDYSASVDVVPSGSGHKYILHLNDGKEKQSVQIDENDATMLNVPKYENNYVPDWAKLLSYKDSTNEGNGNPATAWFGHSDFIKLYNDKELPYTVSADYVKDRSNPNHVWLKLYIHEKDTEGRGKKEPYSIMFPGKDQRPFNLYNTDNTFNTDLIYIPSLIDIATIEALQKKK